MNPAQIAMAELEARNIELARNDPRVKALNLCPVCLDTLPECICVKREKRLAMEHERRKRHRYEATLFVVLVAWIVLTMWLIAPAVLPSGQLFQPPL